MLTLDAWVCSKVKEEVGNSVNRARRAAAVVGKESDGVGYHGLPGSIPSAGRERTMRRSERWSSICVGRLLSAAMQRRRRWLHGGPCGELGFRKKEKRGGERAWEQVSVVVVSFSSAGARRRAGRATAWRQCRPWRHSGEER